MVSFPGRVTDGTAEPQPSHHMPTSARPPRRHDRSCVVCHRRKVRCDRRSPCSACTRNGSLCAYPPSNQAVGRVRKTTISDVASRLSSLEKTITAATIDTTPSTQPSVPGRAFTDHEPRPKERQSPKILLHNQNSSQYFDDLFTTRAIEEDQDQPSLLPRSEDENQVEASDTLLGLMGTPSIPIAADATNTSWKLLTRGALELWRIFTQNVDPSIKILHIPTAEVLFFEAIREPNAVSKDASVVLGAVYFAATSTLEDHEVQHVLGLNRFTALRHFRHQFQRSLSAANILEHPTLLLLQGLAIYLTASRTHSHGRSSWILNGLALRIAQSIGLHRDGSNLGLRPFEAEVRRRLWWHMLARDNRAAEDHGISSSCWLPPSDTKLPLNIHDEDLHPDMRELPPPQAGWTRMSLHLVNMEITQTVHRLDNLFTSASDSNSKELARRDMMDRLRDQVHTYTGSCSSSIPLHKMTMQLALLMVHKVDLVTRQQLVNMDHPGQRDVMTTEENIVAACRCLEIYMGLWADELLLQYRWWLRSYPQYHVLLYVLWHLYVRPDGPNADRAWENVYRLFEIEESTLREGGLSSNTKYIVLQRLKKNAEAMRGSVSNRNLALDEASPSTQSDSRGTIGVQGGLDDQIGMQSLYEESGFLPISIWNNLLEEMNIPQSEFPGIS
ncbi:fungal specific transcription factor [Metarhizium brunneum]